MIDTSKVTTSPYEIHYTAVDALGNIAVPVSRSVFVYNPCLPEAYCTASGELPCLWSLQSNASSTDVCMFAVASGATSVVTESMHNSAQC